MITWKQSERHFLVGEFQDRYENACSIQKSSLANEDCIWLGVDDANPMITIYEAMRLGLPTDGKEVGWIPYKLPAGVLLHTRMHLTQEMAAALIPALQHFVDTGELPPIEAGVSRETSDQP